MIVIVIVIIIIIVITITVTIIIIIISSSSSSSSVCIIIIIIIMLDLKVAPNLLTTVNLRIQILDFSGLDSSRILILRVGILISIVDFLESLSQAILVGIILAGRLGVRGIRKGGSGETSHFFREIPYGRDPGCRFGKLIRDSASKTRRTSFACAPLPY